MCVVETTEVEIKRIRDVDGRFAHDYGEWDRTLPTWRAQCGAYYTQQCRRLGHEPTEDLQLVCERFTVLYPSVRP
jgi:uncharacterized protein YhfF